MINKTSKLVVGLLFGVSLQVFAAGKAWMTDYEAAKAKAAAEDKSMILEFTGSDWCPPCKMMNEQFFSKEEWVKQAEKDFVLVLLDFPKDKSKMTEQTIAQNDKLSTQYGISSYPTLIVADSQGKPLAYTAFFRGSIDEHVASLVEARDGGRKNLAGIKEAMALEGEEKAAKLEAALKDIPAGAILNFFKAELDAIAGADPANSFAKKIRNEAAFGDLENSLGPALEKFDFAGALATIKKVTEENQFEGTSLQRAHFYEAIVTASMGKVDEAKQIAEKAIEIDPSSTEAQQLKMVAAQAQRIADSAKAQQEGGE